MKTAEQAHGHAMEAAKVGNAHTQKMAKIAPQSAVSQPAAGGGNPPAAAANQPDAPVPAKQTKRSSDVVVIQAEMRAAQEDGFIFISSVREPEGVSYRYLNPDHSELYIVHTAKLEPRFNENHDAKGEFTSGSNAEKIEKLKSENAKVLATPLMSEGNISPAQLGMMSKGQLKEYHDNVSKKLEIESQIKELQKPSSQVAAEKEAKDAAETKSRIEALHNKIQDFKHVGTSATTGKIRPTYQKEIDKAQAEIDKLSGRSLSEPSEFRGDDEHDAAGKFASKGSGAATGMAAKHAVITSPAVHAQMVAAYKQAQPTFRPKITATAGTSIPHNEYSFTVDKDGKPSGIVTSGTNDKNTVVVPDGAQAVVHTHPSADHPYPSDADIAYAKSTGVPDYVISSNELWVANPDGTSEKVADIEMKHGDLQIKWNK